MPLLLLAVLGVPLLATTGALSYKSFTDDTGRLVPSVTTLAALGLAGAAVWFVVKKA